MSSSALSHLTTPDDSTWKSLWSAAPRKKEFGRADLQPLSVFLESGVIPRDSRTDNHNELGEDLSRYLVVRPGDIVFNKLRTWQGGLGVSNYEGIVSPAYFVCRPQKGIEARYLHYLLRSRPYLTELTRISKWMPPSQFDTPWENLRRLPVLLPPLTEQRRIADFLDAETARIEHICSIRRSQKELLAVRKWSHFQDVLDRTSAANIPLRRVINSITDGPFGSAFSSGDYVDSGAAVVRLGNIGFAEYKRAEQARIPMSMYERFKGYQVRRGDVLIAGLGDAKNHAGRACVAPDLGAAIVKGKCFRVRIEEKLADSQFISLLLSSPIGAGALEGRGSTRSMINLEIVKSAILPIPSLGEQQMVSKEHHRAWSLTRKAIQLCDHQLDLLAERRQALIAAAVTGQFDVSTASGRNVMEGVAS